MTTSFGEYRNGHRVVGDRWKTVPEFPVTTQARGPSYGTSESDFSKYVVHTRIAAKVKMRTYIV